MPPIIPIKPAGTYEDLSLKRDFKLDDNFKLDDIDKPKKIANEDYKYFSKLGKTLSIEKSDDIREAHKSETEAEGSEGEEKFRSISEFSDRILRLTEIAAKKNIQLPTHDGKSIVDETGEINNNTLNSLASAMGLSEDDTINFSALTTVVKVAIDLFCKLKTSDFALEVNNDPNEPEIKKDTYAILENLNSAFDKMDDFLINLINSSKGNKKLNKELIDAKQEEFAVLHSQLLHVANACIEGNIDKSVESNANKSNEGNKAESIEDVYAGVAAKTSGSASAMLKIKDTINPLLIRLENAKKNIENENKIMTHKALKKEAETVIKRLKDVRDNGYDVGNGIIVPIRSEIDSYISLLETKVLSLNESVKNELKQLKNNATATQKNLSESKSPLDFIESAIATINSYIDANKKQNFIKLRENDYADLLRGNLNPGVLSVAYTKGLTGIHMKGFPRNAKLTLIRELGSGQFNSVKLYKDKDGKEYVFKPGLSSDAGLEASIAMEHLMQKDGNAIPDMMLALKHNVASSYMAEMLGSPNAVTKASFAVINGEYGILMSKAEGLSAKAFAKYNAYYFKDETKKLKLLDFNRDDEDGRAAFTQIEDFDGLDKETRINMTGDLLKGINQLQWSDLLSGQADRNYGNYHVNIDTNSKKVTVTGIDNDVSCGRNMVGLRTLRIPKSTYDSGFKPSANELKDGTDPAIKSVTKKYVDLDLNNLNGRRFAMAFETFGIYGLQLPRVIDETTYNNLMNINKEKYRSKLQEIFNDEDYVNSAVLRMKEAQTYATKLKNKGYVIDDSKWNTSAFQNKLLNMQIEETKKRTGLSTLTRNNMIDAYYEDNNNKGQVQTQQHIGWGCLGEPFLTDFAFMIKHTE